MSSTNEREWPRPAAQLLAREVESVGALRAPRRRPFVAVLGGAKVSDKLREIESLLEVADTLVVGGAMCFAFLEAQGRSVGASLCEHDMVERCRALLDSGADIRLPHDMVALGPGGRLGAPEAGGEVDQTGPDLAAGWSGCDIGPGSAAVFAGAIAAAGTVFWNGPMGAFEDPRFAAGTRAVAAAVAGARAYTVVGGGDSASALASLGLAGEVDHLSTGGGAALEMIAKGDLCGLAALRGCRRRDEVGAA